MDRTKYQIFDAPEPSTSHYQRYTVDRGLGSAQAVNFVVEGHEDDLIDPKHCYLKSTFRILDKEGNVLEDDDGVFFSPNYSSNLWAHASVSLSNTHLAPGNDYPYTALLTDLLGASPEVRDDVLSTLSGFTTPTHSSSKVASALSLNPIVFDDYKTLCANSKELTVYHRVHSDFLQTCAQLLPNRMQLTLTLSRSKDAFVLCRTSTESEYRVEVLSVSLFVKRVVPGPSALKHLNQSLARGGKLHYQRLHMIAFPCAQGSLTWTWHNCFNNVLPRRVFVALVTQESYFGSFDRISTYLESGSVKRVRFCLDGREIMAEPYTADWKYSAPGIVDWEKTDARSPYAGLCRAIGVFASPRQHVGIRYNDYINGSTVFGVSLGQAQGSGSLDVHIEFAQATAEPLMLLVLGEYPKTLSFDASRNLV